MPRRLAQQRMTLSDLEWPFHALCVISAVAELLVVLVFIPKLFCVKCISMFHINYISVLC